METFEIRQPPGQKLPKWQRTYCVDEKGNLYLPADIAGDSTAVTMAAAYDGISAVVIHNHAYFPTSWLAREFPGCKEICDAAIQFHVDAAAQLPESDDPL